MLLNMRKTYKEIVNHKQRCILKSTSYKSMLTLLIYVAVQRAVNDLRTRIGRPLFGSLLLRLQALVLPQGSACRKQKQYEKDWGHYETITVWRACGEERQMAGLLITVITYDSVVCSGRTAILYCIYICIYIHMYKFSNQTKPNSPRRALKYLRNILGPGEVCSVQSVRTQLSRQNSH